MPRDSDEYDPGFERRPRRPAKSNQSMVWILVAVVVAVVLGVIGCCGGIFFWGWHLTTPTWHRYTPASNAYSAEFPQPPNKVTTSTVNGPDGRSYTIAECKHGFPVSTFSIRETVLSPADQKRKPDELLNSIADSWASAGRSKETSRLPGSEGTSTTLDLTLTRGSNTTICLRMVHVKGKVFIQVVESDIFDDTDDPVIEFFDKFAPIGTK